MSSSRLSLIHIRAFVFGCVCRPTPALVLLIMYVSRVFRYIRAQPRPGGRWQPRVKGCRTAARANFCEGARTCVRTRWKYSNASRGLPTHKTNVVCPPVFRMQQHPDLRRRRTAVMRECCRKIPPRILPEIRGGHTFIVVMEKQSSNYIAGIIPIGPGRRYTLSNYFTTTSFIRNCLINPNDPKPQHREL